MPKLPLRSLAGLWLAALALLAAASFWVAGRLGRAKESWLQADRDCLAGRFDDALSGYARARGLAWGAGPFGSDYEAASADALFRRAQASAQARLEAMTDGDASRLAGLAADDYERAGDMRRMMKARSMRSACFDAEDAYLEAGHLWISVLVGIPAPAGEASPPPGILSLARVARKARQEMESAIRPSDQRTATLAFLEAAERLAAEASP